MKIEPTAGKILIKRSEPERKSGGIIIPETAQEKSSKGAVHAVGPFQKDKEHAIKTGDTVFFAKWGGTEIKDDNDDVFIIINVDEILGIERK
jgi:chaperonin GroES